MSAEIKTRRWKRVLGWTLAVVIALPVMAWAVLYGNSVWQRRKAERLCRDFQTLTPGVATTENVRALLAQYSAEDSIGVPWKPNANCTPENCNFEIWVRAHRLVPDTAKPWLFSEHVPLMDRLGLRWWGAKSVFEVREGKLKRSRYSVGFAGETEVFGRCLMAEVKVERTVDNRREWYAEAPPYSVGKPHLTSPCYGDLLRIDLDNRATAAERARAYGFHFSVLTSFSPYARTANLAPVVWADWTNIQRKQEAEPLTPKVE